MYVFPNNLMAHRSQKKEVIKGGLLLLFVLVLIAGLLYLGLQDNQSVPAHNNTYCINTDRGQVCNTF